MSFESWINNPSYELVTDTESNALIIQCTGSIKTTTNEVFDYNDEITIVNDQTNIPFYALHDELISAFNNWIMQKEQEHN